MAGDAKADWVQRVLGVVVPAAEPFDEVAFKRSFRDAIAAWRDASESVDAQLNDIRAALLDTDDKDLHRIAEFGLNGITGKRKVGLQAALLEVGGASGPALPALARKAAQVAEDYRGFVQTDPRVKACDLYPDIRSPIGSTLGGALQTLARSLSH